MATAKWKARPAAEEEEFKDNEYECCDCSEKWIDTADDQQFRWELGFAETPKCCKDCRWAKKIRMEGHPCGEGVQDDDWQEDDKDDEILVQPLTDDEDDDLKPLVAGSTAASSEPSAVKAVRGCRPGWKDYYASVARRKQSERKHRRQQEQQDAKKRYKVLRMEDKKTLQYCQAVNKELQKPLLPIPEDLRDIFDTDPPQETEGTVHRKPSMSTASASLLMPKRAARPGKEPATSKTWSEPKMLPCSRANKAAWKSGLLVQCSDGLDTWYQTHDDSDAPHNGG